MTTKSPIVSIAALVLTLPAFSSWAQTTVLEPVQVTATRSESALVDVPGAISVFDGEDLRRGQALTSLAGMLDQVPGLFVQNAGNFAQDVRLSIRGFGARTAFGIRGVTIIVDGIAQTLPDGQSQVDSIDLASIERIEVLRGPASALYGNAAGGVILITTTRGGQGSRASARQTLGDFGLVDSHAAISAGDENAGVRVSAGRLEQDGFRRHSRVEQYRAAARMDWKPAPATRILAMAGYFEAPMEQDPGALTKQQARTEPRAARDANLAFDAGESLEQWRFGASLDHRFGAVGQQRIALAGFGFLRDFENRLPFESGGQVAFDRSFSGIDFRYENSIPLAGFEQTLSLGIDYRKQDDDRLRFDNLQGLRGSQVLDQQEQVGAVGLYLQQRIELADGWALTAGLRFDRVRLDVDDRRLDDGDDSGSRTWRQASPGAGLVWRARDGLTLYANVGTAFQTPTTTELANPEEPGSGGGFNEDLQPQTARNVEFGLRARPHRRLNLEASIFRMRIDDAISSFEVPEFSGSGRDFFRNAGRSTRQGLEASARLRLHADLRLRAHYSYSDFTFDRFVEPAGDFSGNQLPGVPEHQGGVSALYEPVGGVFGRIDLRWVGDFFADNANRAVSDDYLLVDLSVGKSWQIQYWNIEGFFGVGNLFDTRYNDSVRINAFGGRFFEPGPDRHFHAGLAFEWGARLQNG
ncbi:MAG: TonB-dependent receptor [Wenzhouxiangellaceae bacterium]|nr:TonB-dependent receptor [Wenzhouxiangellaceae bacterium]